MIANDYIHHNSHKTLLNSKQTTYTPQLPLTYVSAINTFSFVLKPLIKFHSPKKYKKKNPTTTKQQQEE